MPLDDEYKEQLKSPIADLPNIGTRWGGSITAAIFLKQFADPLPWAHLDIAGTAWLESDKAVAWVRDSLLANVPYDQFVRELLAATGTVISNPPVAWYKRVKEPKQQLEDVAQLFFGVRLQCAQ